MKQLTIIFFSLFFTACSTNLVFKKFPQEFSNKTADTLWDKLILTPKRYPNGFSEQKPLRLPYEFSTLKTNPGFIPVSKLTTKSTHPLAKAQHIYMHYLFSQKSYLHHMIVEFSTPMQAKKYLKRIQLRHNEALTTKIYRIERFVFTFTLRNYHNEDLLAKTHPDFFIWVEQRIKAIKSSL